ncbi:MAG: hypothetical protein Q9M28_09585 [Mariprofundaceae bacterium]|nr:hypothetical protein [Mariprofundaceae bacterium]
MWRHWVTEYDENRLAQAMHKTCDSEVNMQFAMNVEGESPVSLLKLSAAATGEVNYQFPRGYRYDSAIFEDRQQHNMLKILKTIKCKPSSSSDWVCRTCCVCALRPEF